jgi:hypothetical protein
MSDGLNGLYKLGGISFMASGSLFLGKTVLELMTGSPPSSGAEILAWTASRELLLAITNEVFFFAVMFLVPAVIALHGSLARTHRSHAAIGCGIMAVTIPGLYVLAIVHGRLVFPVFHIRVHTPEVAELVVAIYYGGLHAVAILLAVATFALSLAMRRGAYGSTIAYLGFATAAFDVMGAYPDVMGPILGLVSGIFFAAWFVAVGFRLYRMPAAVQS